ncbi:MAG: hypothetical protein JXA01_04490 [Dehalococcoidia bacterium]|nr:hypothetical protein [Dehalococcoidia bacterium]
MGKKSRRIRAKGKIAESSQRPVTPVSQSRASSATAVKGNSRQAAGSVAPVLYAVNHDYVKSDLIRIGIIAGALILIMVILTFIPALNS